MKLEKTSQRTLGLILILILILVINWTVEQQYPKTYQIEDIRTGEVLKATSYKNYTPLTGIIVNLENLDSLYIIKKTEITDHYYDSTGKTAAFFIVKELKE